MKKTYQLLIFDLDGTLIDSRLDIAQAVVQSFDELGLKKPEQNQIVRHIGLGVSHLIAGILSDSGNGNDPHLQKKAKELFLIHYSKVCTHSSKPYPGVSESLAGLSEKYKTAIFTNKPGELTEKVIGFLDWQKYFNPIFSGGSEAPKKPDPTGVEMIIQKNRVDAEHTLFIGDSSVDAQTAQNAGVDFAFARYGFDPNLDLKKFPNTWVCDQFYDLLKEL